MITVAQALNRTKFYHGSMAIKTVGRRVAQSWRARYPDEPIEMVISEGFQVNIYPSWFRERIMKIAAGYSKQRDRDFIVAPRKRKRKSVGNPI